MPAIALGAAAAGIGGWSGFLGFTGLTGALLAGASSLALSGLQRALQPSIKKPDLSAFANIKGGGLTKQVRQPITARRLVYGEARVSGPFIYIGSTNDNKYLHMVFRLADHQVQEIGEVWINDVSITDDMLDVNGNVTSGMYSGKCRIKKHDGDPTQGADSSMVGEIPDWTTNHRLQGIAYLYIRLEFDRTVYAGGIPNISAWVKGLIPVDTRDSVERWTNNAMLLNYAYLTDTKFGVGAASTSVDTDLIDAGANTCDEFVTTANLAQAVSSVDTSGDMLALSGEMVEFQTGDRVQVTSTGSIPSGISGATNYYVIPYQRISTPRIKLASSYANALAGTAIDITSAGSGVITVTKNAEARYTLNGVIDTDGNPQEIYKNLLTAMSGKAIYVGGKWSLSVGGYATPTIEFGKADMHGPLTMQTNVSRRDRFNNVQGVYVSPLNYAQPMDYPLVKNDTYATEDGETIPRRYDLPYTTRPHTAQRLAKIELERSRQEITVSGIFKLSAFLVQCGDNILLTFDEYGFDQKPFEIIEWALTLGEQDGVPVPLVNMKLRETASTIWDWNSGEETSVDPAPNTTLPSASVVTVPTGVAFDSEAVATSEGDNTHKMILSWDAHPDTFVLENGFFEIQYKKSDTVEWKPSFYVNGVLTRSDVFQAAVDTEYDLRLRAVNNLGAVSAWVTLLGVVVGTGGGVTESDNWGTFGDSASSFEDWGEFGDSVTSEEEWGQFV
jgi:hypothetical protein